MILKLAKWTFLGVVGLGVAGGLVLGWSSSVGRLRQ